MNQEGKERQHVLVEGQEVARITLNRPEQHNPFDAGTIAALTGAFKELAARPDLRAVVITGAGKSFCAGADLNWMRGMGQATPRENLEDARKLAAMFDALESVEVPVIARVNGTALGGGAGLVCASDIAIASEKARIGFSEVRLGLLPGVISPYVMDRIGPKKAAWLFTTGTRLKAKEARKLGLVDIVAEHDELDDAVESVLGDILAGGPVAVRECKALARNYAAMPRAEFKEYCIQAIARLRSSPEGQEGVMAFLEKQEPAWRGGGDAGGD